MVFSVFRPTQTKSEGRSENALYSPTTSPIRSATSSKSWTKSSTSLLGSPLSSTEDLEPDLRELNNDLRALAEIFPNVRPDVFREMLSSLSDESRSHVVADQLLRFGAKWVRGRWRVASNITSSRILCEVFDINSQKVVHSTELVPCEEEFRSLSYKNATRTALKEEFQGISRSAIEGVLVEQNYSYTNSRPILTGLAAKSWRINFKSIMRWKKPTVESHFMLVQSKPVSEQSAATPKLKKTGSAELDEELYRTVLEPLLKGYREHNELSGWELATCLNKEEAALHRATFECECCFDDVAFEFIAFCSTGEHQLCFKCLQNTVSAALYAQAWAKSIDHERSLISCFAPSSEACHGCIPNELAKRAILQTRGGQQTWDKFEEKLAKDAMRAGLGTRLKGQPILKMIMTIVISAGISEHYLGDAPSAKSVICTVKKIRTRLFGGQGRPLKSSGE
ncbi:MAG: hypothetical protein LQ340_005187 [Diploschistes diacapsis]|nr:MAG: hypothetical protein LQ340_005187 [Diploschistes diacapsis]